MRVSKNYVAIEKALFSPDGMGNLSEEQRKIALRWQSGFTIWLATPNKPTSELAGYLVNEFSISKRQAYLDIQSIKLLLGNVATTQKEWMRYKVDDLTEQALAILNKTIEGEDGEIFSAVSKTDIQIANTMLKAAEVIVKAHKLDKEEGEPIPYDEIVPQSFEPTGDVSVLGIKPIENLEEKQEQLRRKYGSTNVEYAKILPNDGE